MELLALPGVGRVVVALGALDLHAQEDPRDLAGHLDRPGAAWARAKLTAPFSSLRPVAGDQSAWRSRPRGVLGELLGQPVLEHGVADLLPFCVGRAELDHVAPVAGPVAGVVGAAEQVVDQLGPLAAVRRGQDEGADLLGRRQLAGDVEVDPADEFARRSSCAAKGALASVTRLLDQGVEAGRVERRRHDRPRGPGRQLRARRRGLGLGIGPLGRADPRGAGLGRRLRRAPGPPPGPAAPGPRPPRRIRTTRSDRR